jgi:hypothetical protein
MKRDLDLAPGSTARWRVKKTAMSGIALFFVGIASIVATWVLQREVWIASGVVTLVGAFLIAYALVARSTKMGEAP